MTKKSIFAIFCFCFFFILLLGELGTILFFRVTKKDIDVYRNFSFERSAKIMMPDPVLGYKLIPNVSRNAFTSEFQLVYTTNSDGLREKEIVDTDKFKILFLGDSFTFGEGVAYGYRFSDLIEKEIENVYAINAGVPGYGIHQMYLWLKDYGLSLKPDLVICSIIPADLDRVIYEEIDKAPHLIRGAGEEKRAENKFKQWAKSSWGKIDSVLKGSYLYCVVQVRVKTTLMWAYLQERDKMVWKEIVEKGGRGGRQMTTEFQREMVEEQSKKIFIGFKDLLRQKNINFLVVNIAPSSLPWLEDFLKDQNIRYLDLAPELRKVPHLQFEIDGHYNALGHRAIADYLVKHLRMHVIGYSADTHSKASQK